MENEDTQVKTTSSNKIKKSLLRKDASAYTQELSNRGVIYVSRVPPFMKPNKMRNIFEEYGEVTRLYLAEESAEVKKKRKDAGGNGSKQFHEGWVEYADKKIAKQVAESLNNTSIGGKKSSFYHDDIWNLKYLKSFKWEYLTEKIAYERRVRENKLKAAMQITKKQNAEFVELVDSAKLDKFVQERKEKRRKQDGVDEESMPVKSLKRPRVGNAKSFHQVKAMAVNYGENVTSKMGKTTLRSIFPSR